MDEELFTRYERNLFSTAADWPARRSTPSSTRPPSRFDGETLLLVRVEDRTGRSRLGVARSADGLTGWTVEPERVAPAGPRLGGRAVRDRGSAHHAARRRVPDRRTPATRPDGPLVCLAATRDFRSYERRGVVLPPENKDAALFPERVRRPLRDAPSPA